MTHTLALGSQEIALELHQLLREFDPAAVRAEVADALAERLDALSGRIKDLLEATPTERGLVALRARLAELGQCLDEQRSRATGARRAWKAAHRQLQMAYQQLAEGLRSLDVHVPALRPTNYVRNAFHIAAGLSAVALVEFVFAPEQLVWVAAAFFTYAWSMELGRRVSPRLNTWLMGHYAKVAHPHEWHRVNSSTWFTTAMLVLTLTYQPLLCAVACGVLALADPAAALVGRRHGRTKLVNGRSLEGSLTFFAVAMAVALSVTLGLHGMTLGVALAAAFGASLLSTLAELLSRRIDDNLSVPLSAAAGTWLALLLVGAPL